MGAEPSRKCNQPKVGCTRPAVGGGQSLNRIERAHHNRNGCGDQVRSKGLPSPHRAQVNYSTLLAPEAPSPPAGFRSAEARYAEYCLGGQSSNSTPWLARNAMDVSKPSPLRRMGRGIEHHVYILPVSENLRLEWHAARATCRLWPRRGHPTACDMRSAPWPMPLAEEDIHGWVRRDLVMQSPAAAQGVGRRLRHIIAHVQTHRFEQDDEHACEQHMRNEDRIDDVATT